MAITNEVITNRLDKKVNYGLTRTDFNSNKTFVNESIPSPIPNPTHNLWMESHLIPDGVTGWNSGGDWGASDIFGFALDLDSATKKFILYRSGSAVNGSGTNLPSAFQDEYLSPFAAGYDAYEQYWNFGGYTQISISSAASYANGYGTF